MAIRLSILVCSTHNRYNNFLLQSLDSLFYQWNLLQPAEQDEVEIISVIDNKKMILGDKRSKMVEMAQGEYVAFFDCDDRPSSDYIDQLLAATKQESDVIVFDVMVSINGAPAKLCQYSKEYNSDYNDLGGYYRLPNHLMCVKRELAIQIKFKSVLFGEDADYAKRLKPLLKTEYNIGKVLYYYDFNSKTTETQVKR